MSSRFIPGNSRRVAGPGVQSRPPQPPEGSNMDRNGQNELELEKSNSDPNSVRVPGISADVEMDEAHRPEQGLGMRRTGAAFTSDELKNMTHEDLIKNLKDAQRGKIINKPQEGSGDITVADPPSMTTEAPVAHNLNAQERKKAVMAKALSHLLSGNNWHERGESINQLTPAWGEGFAANMRVWKKEYISQVRVESEMDALSRDYLRTVPDDEFLQALEKGVWKTYLEYARKQARGILEDSQAVKRYNNRRNERKSTKATQRIKANKDTCVDSKSSDFKFLYQPRAQSPPVRDRDDKDREIVLVPSFVSDKLLAIKASLDVKASLVSKSSESKRVVYVKVDEPITKLDGEQWPAWAINKDWRRDHPEEYEKHIHLIDHTRSVMPNVGEFTNRYKAPRRQFLDHMPPGADLLEDDRRSATPALAPREDSVAPREDSVAPSDSNPPIGEHGPREHTPARPSAPTTTVEAEQPISEPLHPPLPLTGPHYGNKSHVPRDYWLNGGHYVDGQFVPTPSTSEPTSAPTSSQVFGIPIDPVLLKGKGPTAGPLTLPTTTLTSTPKRNLKVTQEPKSLKRQKKATTTTQPPRQSAHHQKNQADEDGDMEGGGEKESLVVKISRRK
ncbi:hypothetical protein BN14_11136 [Rhizoctonia solani AG-1 IB]|uniref:Uncharacterized protein n=1 Tax=Thanatephorus cucumeris (strain AG1-IB / isolate 7/3/14) TaxID=1108050 RepID=M5CGZ7_THACB|nr:hypothetical protein BN14_11136 [Rhizoctonia solani AG-1 IB]